MRSVLRSGGAAFALMLALAGAVLPAAVSAQEEEITPNAFVRGQGVLTAGGDGLVAVKGRMDLVASGDRGVVLVKDLAGDGDVDITGIGGTGTYMGFDVYFGVHGRMHVTGSHVAVIIVGDDVRLHVAGRGWAYLKGRGRYELNGLGPIPVDG